MKENLSSEIIIFKRHSTKVLTATVTFIQSQRIRKNSFRSRFLPRCKLFQRFFFTKFSRNSNCRPVLGQAVAVDIFTTENIGYAFYYIVSKGLLLSAKKVDIRNRKGKFLFTPTFAFAPQANIIIYYVSNGEIISSSTSVELRTNLFNSVRVF